MRWPRQGQCSANKRTVPPPTDIRTGHKFFYTSRGAPGCVHIESVRSTVLRPPTLGETPPYILDEGTHVTKRRCARTCFITVIVTADCIDDQDYTQEGVHLHRRLRKV